MTVIGFLPMIVPFAAGLLLLMNRGNRAWQCSVAGAGIALLVGTSVYLLAAVLKHGMIVIHFGNWPPPITILFAIDTLSAVMVCLTALVGGTAVLYSLHDIGEERRHGSYYGVFFFLLFGINGSFLTGDLFNLFVFFEVVLMSSYVLLTLGNGQRQAKYGFSYLAINLTGSTLFLAGAGLLYGLLGTLNMAHIAERIGGVEQQGLVTGIAMIFLVVFGIKSAMFPLYNWLPDAYPAPPTPVSALFAGLLTKVGVYAMYRVFGTIFVLDIGFTHHQILLPLSGLTMLLGVWGAVVQYDVKYILAFHSISQVGYILMGLALHSPLALAAGIFHMIHHSLIKSSLFLIGGGMENIGGSQHLKKIGGVLHLSATLGVFFMISALALSGVPPLSGFFSKLGLVAAGLRDSHPWIVTAALVTSLFTLYSMIKIWRLGFWGKPVHASDRKEKDAPLPSAGSGFLWSCGVSVLLVIFLSLFAGPVMRISKIAGDDLLNRDRYIKTVLESRPRAHPQRGAL